MPYKMMLVKLMLNDEQQRIFSDAKKAVEADLGGGISDEQFVQMMLMEAARTNAKKD